MLFRRMLGCVLLVRRGGKRSAVNPRSRHALSLDYRRIRDRPSVVSRRFPGTGNESRPRRRGRAGRIGTQNALMADNLAASARSLRAARRNGRCTAPGRAAVRPALALVAARTAAAAAGAATRRAALAPAAAVAARARVVGRAAEGNRRHHDQCSKHVLSPGASRHKGSLSERSLSILRQRGTRRDDRKVSALEHMKTRPIGAGAHRATHSAPARGVC